jgi:hypothetical protein
MLTVVFPEKNNHANLGVKSLKEDKKEFLNFYASKSAAKTSIR